MCAINEAIIRQLFGLQDPAYRELQYRLLPTVAAERIIGVRTPALRQLAKQLQKSGDAGAFLKELPHRYFEENQLHAFLISEVRDFAVCLAEVDKFLPFVDNWATCDQMSPKVFRKHRSELLIPIRSWIDSGQTYTVRFAVGQLMAHFLDEDFDPACPELAAAIRSDEYYVRMMVAWYFATALAKQYEAILPYLEQRRLDPWTHNRTIQKAVESFRVSPEHKEYLRGLRLKGAKQLG